MFMNLSCYHSTVVNKNNCMSGVLCMCNLELLLEEVAFNSTPVLIKLKRNGLFGGNRLEKSIPFQFCNIGSFLC